MRIRVRNTFGPVLAYHGCDRSLAERVLAHQAELESGSKTYHWLGPGVYFWIDSPARALEWATINRGRNQVSRPYVLGAYIYPGLCLNITDYAAGSELKNAFEVLQRIKQGAGELLPSNTAERKGVKFARWLDHAVFETVHALRAETGAPPYDTVIGVWEEGEPVYPGAEIRDKTHVQMAVRNVDAIVGYFRVRGL